MRKIITYLKNYISTIDFRVMLPAMLFIALGIFCNYHFHLNRKIASLSDAEQYAAWYGIFISAFGFPYFLQWIRGKLSWPKDLSFSILFFAAPAIFSWKMVADVSFQFSHNNAINAYWNHVVYWPFKLMIVSTALYVLWRLFDRTQPFYGTGLQQFSPKPYLIMLLIMIPLIAAASTQPDFLAVYPKLKTVSFFAQQQHTGWYKLLYELAYGSDFISIELFFRGFLVLAFARWFGKDAILPMALFYCTIHFGKPMGECISSFFGGLILGVVTYNTRTILGGLMVHLGIAWLMELGGYLGNL